MSKADIVRRVNEAIAKEGGKAELKYSRVGGSFFYFQPVGRRGAPSSPYPEDSTVEQLLEAWKVEEVDETISPRSDW